MKLGEMFCSETHQVFGGDLDVNLVLSTAHIKGFITLSAELEAVPDICIPKVEEYLTYEIETKTKT